MTVVGLETRFAGDSSVFGDLWDEVVERWDDIEATAATDTAYGVTTSIDAEAGEYEYVLGFEAVDPDAPPDEFTVVDIPGGPYAVYETTLGTFEADLREATTEWLPNSVHEHRGTPEYERYGPEFEGADPDSPFTYWIPITDS